ncbi:hypothetical protein BB561_001024 [Smittium simulii]|uniref:Uncharacterized protein n=1 Tax=Smittium simulii TaxID=133385 RepID=A0A2T9YWI4_9FUNG|nr:hypothetical protein BB561_001024 [Smittium simulii]
MDSHIDDCKNKSGIIECIEKKNKLNIWKKKIIVFDLNGNFGYLKRQKSFSDLCFEIDTSDYFKLGIFKSLIGNKNRYFTDNLHPIDSIIFQNVKGNLVNMIIFSGKINHKIRATNLNSETAIANFLIFLSKAYKFVEVNKKNTKCLVRPFILQKYNSLEEINIDISEKNNDKEYQTHKESIKTLVETKNWENCLFEQRLDLFSNRDILNQKILKFVNESDLKNVNLDSSLSNPQTEPKKSNISNLFSLRIFGEQKLNDAKEIKRSPSENFKKIQTNQNSTINTDQFVERDKSIAKRQSNDRRCSIKSLSNIFKKSENYSDSTYKGPFNNKIISMHGNSDDTEDTSTKHKKLSILKINYDKNIELTREESSSLFSKASSQLATEDKLKLPDILLSSGASSSDIIQYRNKTVQLNKKHTFTHNNDFTKKNISAPETIDTNPCLEKDHSIEYTSDGDVESLKALEYSNSLFESSSSVFQALSSRNSALQKKKAKVISTQKKKMILKKNDSLSTNSIKSYKSSGALDLGVDGTMDTVDQRALLIDINLSKKSEFSNFLTEFNNSCKISNDQKQDVASKDVNYKQGNYTKKNPLLLDNTNKKKKQNAKYISKTICIKQRIANQKVSKNDYQGYNSSNSSEDLVISLANNNDKEKSALHKPTNNGIYTNEFENSNYKKELPDKSKKQKYFDNNNVKSNSNINNNIMATDIILQENLYDYLDLYSNIENQATIDHHSSKIISNKAINIENPQNTACSSRDQELFYADYQLANQEQIQNNNIAEIRKHRSSLCDSSVIYKNNHVSKNINQYNNINYVANDFKQTDDFLRDKTDTCKNLQNNIAFSNSADYQRKQNKYSNQNYINASNSKIFGIAHLNLAAQKIQHNTENAQYISNNARVIPQHPVSVYSNINSCFGPKDTKNLYINNTIAEYDEEEDISLGVLKQKYNNITYSHLANSHQNNIFIDIQNKKLVNETDYNSLQTKNLNPCISKNNLIETNYQSNISELSKIPPSNYISSTVQHNLTSNYNVNYPGIDPIGHSLNIHNKDKRPQFGHQKLQTVQTRPVFKNINNYKLQDYNNTGLQFVGISENCAKKVDFFNSANNKKFNNLENIITENSSESSKKINKIVTNSETYLISGSESVANTNISSGSDFGLGLNIHKDSNFGTLSTLVYNNGAKNLNYVSPNCYSSNSSNNYIINDINQQPACFLSNKMYKSENFSHIENNHNIGLYKEISKVKQNSEVSTAQYITPLINQISAKKKIKPGFEMDVNHNKIINYNKDRNDLKQSVAKKNGVEAPIALNLNTISNSNNQLLSQNNKKIKINIHPACLQQQQL